MYRFLLNFIDTYSQVARLLTSKREKKRATGGRVVVEEVDHKFVIPSTFGPEVPTTPVSLKKRGVAKLTDPDSDSNINTSPKKKYAVLNISCLIFVHIYYTHIRSKVSKVKGKAIPLEMSCFGKSSKAFRIRNQK